MQKVKFFEALVDKMIENKVISSNDDIKLLIDSNSLSLAGLYENQNEQLQSKVFKEIIPFLEERGVIISEKSVNEVMNFVSLVDFRSNAFEINDSRYTQIKEMINEKMNNRCTEEEADYINSILIEDIFGQLNKNIVENKTQGKTK